MQTASLVIGHRGASREAPENTLASFELAWTEGADGIEADFRLTRDGQIVCIHDASTGRTAGVDLEIACSSLAELRRLDVGMWKSPLWAGAKIPTLAEVLAALPMGKKLYIEIKSGEEIVAPLADLMAASGVSTEAVRFLSFSEELITAVKARLPAWKCCWLTDYKRRGGGSLSREELLAILARCGGDGLAARSGSRVNEELVAALMDAGREIHVWTVDDPATARRLLGLGVDSIMTNRPGWLRQRMY